MLIGLATFSWREGRWSGLHFKRVNKVVEIRHPAPEGGHFDCDTDSDTDTDFLSGDWFSFRQLSMGREHGLQTGTFADVA